MDDADDDAPMRLFFVDVRPAPAAADDLEARAPADSRRAAERECIIFILLLSSDFLYIFDELLL